MVLKLCFQHRPHCADKLPEAGFSLPIALVQANNLVKAIGDHIERLVTDDPSFRGVGLVERRPAHRETLARPRRLKDRADPARPLLGHAGSLSSMNSRRDRMVLWPNAQAKAPGWLQATECLDRRS